MDGHLRFLPQMLHLPSRCFLSCHLRCLLRVTVSSWCRGQDSNPHFRGYGPALCQLNYPYKNVAPQPPMRNHLQHHTRHSTKRIPRGMSGLQLGCHNYDGEHRRTAPGARRPAHNLTRVAGPPPPGFVASLPLPTNSLLTGPDSPPGSFPLSHASLRGQRQSQPRQRYWMPDLTPARAFSYPTQPRRL